MSTEGNNKRKEGGSAMDVDDTQIKKVAVKRDTQSKQFVMTPEVLKIYYDKLFPTSLMFKWLSYNAPDLIKRREFSFTLKDDVYIRYCSFKTKEEFKAGLVSKVPYKIDIGPVFNAPPSMHTSVPQFTPLQKEMVFDIDMTDYDDVRTCCKGAAICLLCWPLMTAAVKVVDTGLREDFGFKHLLWVYSGRRGVHCWVADKSARMLQNNGRSAVAEYLSIYLGNENSKGEMDLRFPLHPHLERAYNQLIPYFEELVDTQGIFRTENLPTIMSFLANAVGQQGAFEWTDRELDSTGLEKWEALKRKVNMYITKHGKKTPYPLRTVLQKIVFTYCYPRLDINVSKQLNHLLKAPFCVHPKTGKVCVPMDPGKADEFDPMTVPQLYDLHDELNAAMQARDTSDADSAKKAWQQTSMAPYIKLFSEFVEPMLAEHRDHSRADKISSGMGVEDW